MKFLRSLETKAYEGDPTGPPRWLGHAQRSTIAGQPPWLNWSTLRAVTDGYERDPYVFRAIHAIAVAISRLPVVLRQDDPWHGTILDTTEDPLLQILNRRANGIEFGSAFRYRLVTQLFLSKRGVFVERVKSNGGKLLGLHLLPPDATYPIAPTAQELRDNPNALVSRFDVKLPGLPILQVPADDVCWIRWPHPIDAYSGVTPMESLGLSIDTSFYARLHNRTFLANDGRPGGVLALKGRLSSDEQAELQSRFGGKQPAGRTSVISVEDASYLDMAATPREMAYGELRGAMKEEILMGVGTPESMAGNASGRTFANADAERENWYVDDVLPNAELIGQALSIWTAGGEEDDNVVGYDTSKIAVLQRFERDRLSFALQEFLAGTRTRTEYRLAAGREPLTPEELGDLYGAAPVADPTGSGKLTPALGAGTPALGPGQQEKPPPKPVSVALPSPSLGGIKSEPPPFAPATGHSVQAVLRKRRHL